MDHPRYAIAWSARMSAPRTCNRCHRRLLDDEPDGPCAECTATLDPGPGSAAGPPGPAPASDHVTVRSRRDLDVPEPQDLRAHFPHLEILDLLGQGGMGCIYRARQRDLDRMVALKLLQPRHGADPSFAERFGREARALARLSHPGIVAVFDSGRANGHYYFIMEYVDGLNLRQLLARNGGRLELAEAARLVADVCAALEYAHEEGIVHRDIKPENILIDRRGRVKIADFGLVKLVSENQPAAGPALTATRALMGTPHYMAPEQTERPTQVDHRVDLYALGVVLYEMLTGELPLGRFPLPSEIGRGDPRLDQLVLRALEKDPQRRFQSASEIRTAITSLAGAAGAGVASRVAVPTSWSGAATPAPGWTPGRGAASADFDRALARVRGPAGFMLFSGAVSLALNGTPAVILGLVTLFTSARGAKLPWFLIFLASSICSWVVIQGAMAMKRLERRRLAQAACLLCMLPTSPACWLFLMLPAGLWASQALASAEVTAAFAARDRDASAAR
jgi:hypothetical protein